MKKQTVIVTCVSSNIGREIARRFLRNGDNVVINAATNEKLNEIFYELGAGANLATVAGDVSDKITGVKLLAVAIAKFGSADVLINNFGIFEHRSFLNIDEVYLDNLLNKSLKSVVMTTQQIIPQMLRQGHGVVINIGSPVYSHTSLNYAGAAILVLNGGINSLTIQLMAEFGKHNIRFNTILPVTLKAGNISSPNGGELLAGMDEMANLVEMVHSVAKSSFITGAIITT